MQLSLKGKEKSGFYLSLGASIIDAVYGALAVSLQIYLANQIEFTNYFYLVAALVLAFLGISSLRSKVSISDVKVLKDERIGFLKGVVLGVLNPLAMPFWLGVTTYLKVNGLIVLDGQYYWAYVAGVFLGEIIMLIVIVKIGSKFTRLADNHKVVNTIPGIAFLILATVNLVQWGSYYL